MVFQKKQSLASKIARDLIGKIVKITYQGKQIQGITTDETKNTITLNNKTFIKKNIIIEFEDIKVKGEKITKRPEDKIKLLKKKW